MSRRIREDSPLDILLLVVGFVVLFAILWKVLPDGREEQIPPHPPVVREEPVMASRELPEHEYVKMRLEVSAYAPMDNKSGICCDGTPATTATGTYPNRGTVAVNPRVFGYGTAFIIPGYGIGIAEDTGAVVRKHTDKIEVVMDSYEEAIEWGRKCLVVLVEVNSNDER